MKNQISSFCKLSFLALLSTFTLNAYAEYYVVYQAPCGGCGYSAHHRVVRHYRPHRYYRVVRHHYARCTSTCKSGCYSGCARNYYPSAWINGHWNCYGEWVAGHWRNFYYQNNYGYPTMIYDPDLTTGDDNPMLDPDMDIDR